MRKKLIEVALDDINAGSAREKSIRHGHRRVAPAFCSISVEAVDCEEHV